MDSQTNSATPCLPATIIHRVETTRASLIIAIMRSNPEGGCRETRDSWPNRQRRGESTHCSTLGALEPSFLPHPFLRTLINEKWLSYTYIIFLYKFKTRMKEEEVGRRRKWVKAIWSISGLHYDTGLLESPSAHTHAITFFDRELIFFGIKITRSFLHFLIFIRYRTPGD
jgi:hypothetical protein